MKINRKTQITILTERVTTVVRQSEQPRVELECDACRRPVQMLLAEHAARLAATSHRVIYQLVESGKLHALETGDGSLLICTVSLAALDDRSTEVHGLQQQGLAPINKIPIENIK